MEVRMIQLSEIRIGSDRFRTVKPKAKEIADSMLKFGQLQPVIVDRDFNLVDGAHRCEAARLNGTNEVLAVFRDEVDDLFLREMELEANIMREDMTWQERTAAIAKLHQIKSARDPNWTQGRTAAVAGSDQRDVSQAITVSKMMELFPEIGEAKSLNQALKWSKSKAKSVLRIQEVKSQPEDFSAIEERLRLGNSVEVIKTIPDATFDAVITDPPFGINYDDRKAGTSGSLTSYEDDEAAYERLLSMAPDLYRVIKPSGWLVWFFGMSWYERCKQTFRDAGFNVDELPIIWDRSEGRAFTTRPDRYFGRAYDVALHCFKGEPQIIQRGKPNIIRVAPVGNAERETLVERPVELYAELIRRLTVEGEYIADFFTGSGSCLAAAALLKRRYFGVELDPERRAYAIKKIRAYSPERPA